MTKKLYDEDAYLKTFTARVLDCRPEGEKYLVLLDATAFFPEEGGQGCDGGTLGGVAVEGVFHRGTEILHRLAKPLTVGSVVDGVLDFDARFRKMQNHTAEHMFSGFCHRKFGCNNVGFRLGSRDMTADFDKELSEEEIWEAEWEVNRYISENRTVTAEYPSPQALANMEYRAKISLSEGVRVVTVEGVDACACCAPHVKKTGEIGIFKVLSFLRYKGGVRVHMLAGFDALEDYRMRLAQTAQIGEALSVKQEEAAEAVLRLQKELSKQKLCVGALKRALLAEKVKALPVTQGNLLLFEEESDMDLLRGFANAAREKSGGICAAFGGKNGDWKYVMVSAARDLRALASEINAAIGGRGGGASDMIQGSARATEEEIRAYFQKL